MSFDPSTLAFLKGNDKAFNDAMNDISTSYNDIFNTKENEKKNEYQYGNSTGLFDNVNLMYDAMHQPSAAQQKINMQIQHDLHNKIPEKEEIIILPPFYNEQALKIQDEQKKLLNQCKDQKKAKKNVQQVGNEQPMIYEYQNPTYDQYVPAKEYGVYVQQQVVIGQPVFMNNNTKQQQIDDTSYFQSTNNLQMPLIQEIEMNQIVNNYLNPQFQQRNYNYPPNSFNSEQQYNPNYQQNRQL